MATMETRDRAEGGAEGSAHSQPGQRSPSSPVARRPELCGVVVRRKGTKWVISWGSGWLQLSPIEGTLLVAVLLAGHLSQNDAIDLLYGDREDGGPDWAERSLKVRCHSIRALLRKAGAPFTIKGTYWPGLCLLPSDTSEQRAA